MTTMMLVVGLVGVSLAAKEETTPAAQASGQLNGQVSYGDTGIAIFSRERVPAGTCVTTEAGAQVPTVLTYTDENGEAHYFINAETAADLFDVACGFTYNEKLQCVDFGTEWLSNDGELLLDEDGKPQRWVAEPDYSITTITVDGTTVSTGNIPTRVVTGGATVTIGSEPEEAELADMPAEWREEMARRDQERLQKKLETSTTAEYGTTRGMFTEVDPAVVDLATLNSVDMSRDTLRSADEVSYTFAFTPRLGAYARLVIENESATDILVKVKRPHALGEVGSDEYFSTVRIPAGQTLVRAFLMDESGAEPGNRLTVTAETVDGSEVQVRLSSETYTGSVQK
jgi:hypothetical protein